jgi:hypothetical protein
MAIKRKPKHPVARDYKPSGSLPYKVKTGDSLKKIAKRAGITWQELAEYNWKTSVPAEVNWYLGSHVGCTAETPDGDNYSFRDSDSPGIIYVPQATSGPNRTSRRHRDSSGHSTLRRTPPPIIVIKIPLGAGREFSKPKRTIGKIYVPTKWGGKLIVHPSSGKAQLFYKNGKDIDDATQGEIIKGQHSVSGPANLVEYDVPKDKHGWYFVMIKGTSSALVFNTFSQEGKASDRPWNGWYCPTEPNTNPNLYEQTGNFTPLKNYDLKYGTSTRSWEAANHVGTLGWEGHCWGWSLASISKKNPKNGSGSFSKWEIRAFYTELADDGTSGWKWKIGKPTNEIPSGPVSSAPNQPPDRWVKRFHDGIRKWIRDQKKIMNADLRGNGISIEWAKSGSVELKISGVQLYSANSRSGLLANLIWHKVNSTLKFHDGPEVPITGNGSFTLGSSIGSIEIRVNRAQLPGSNATGKVKLSSEVWNHSIFKYSAGFKEEANDNDEKYIEINMKIIGNDDTPFPPGETSTVSREYTYRLTYNDAGDTTTSKQNWVSCHDDLPPSCLGIVENEATFGWKANCGITKARVDAL